MPHYDLVYALPVWIKSLRAARFAAMKILLPLSLFLSGLVLLGCATPSNQRISQNEALFNSYTPAEKRLIRMGEVAVGFDQDQVLMALGQPSRETVIDTAGGKQIVWEYREIRPSVGFTLGGGIGTRGSGVGVGTGVGVSPSKTKLLKRIVFDRQTGEVSKVESYN
jgi:hypothetical protein